MQFGDLRVDVTEDDASMRLDWRGKSNARQPELHLNPFLTGIAAQAIAKKSLIEMHFEDLEFFNSSTITVIIQHVKDARAKGIKLILSYDKAQKWQKIFFDALSMFEKSDGLLKINAVER
jgi:hypothetical protein